MGTPRPDMPIPPERMRRILIGLFLLILGALLYMVIHHFVVALAWASILVLTCWPLHRRLLLMLPRRPGTVAFLMTLMIGLGIVVPLGIVGVLLVGEAQELGDAIQLLLKDKELVESAGDVPLVGEELKKGLQWIQAPNALSDWMKERPDRLVETGRMLVSRIFGSLFDFFVCMFATFFLFRHGLTLGDQIKRGVRRLGGDRLEELMRHVQETVKAVVYGLVMTAIAQAIVSALGFWLFGVPYPLLLGILMFFVSFIPFGPPFIWVPASLILLKDSYLFAALMFVYGAALISTLDNIFRPIFIGQATKMSVLLVFFGVLGGIFSFGMVGLFVGPVVIAVTLALWREWVSRSSGPFPQREKRRSSRAGGEDALAPVPDSAGKA